jgi:hypothetical protein
VASTVDVANATYANTIGAAMLSAAWKDPAFDAGQHAFYYVRLIQIPSPRWTAYDQKRYGIKMADYVPMTVTTRAYAERNGRDRIALCGAGRAREKTLQGARVGRSAAAKFRVRG